MIDNILHQILLFVSQYGYAGIFLLMFLENIGLPVPTEIGFIVGQTLVAKGVSSYPDIFFVILLGKTAGSAVSFVLGRYFAGKIKLLHRSARLKSAQLIFSRWTDKYGNLAVLISRLVGYIRPWSSYLAGLGEIKPTTFFIYNILGSMVIIIFTMLILGGAVEIWRGYPELRVLAIPLFLIFLFSFWIGVYVYNRNKRLTKKG